MLRIEGVAKARLVGDPGEQVTIEWDEVQARRYGVPATELVRRLQALNTGLPGGLLRLDGRSAALDPGSELDSVEDLRRTSLVMASGTAVALGDVARVRVGPREPTLTLMRVDGARGVALGVVPEAGLHVVALGERIRSELDALRQELAPLEIQVLSFQSDYVQQRLRGLGGALLAGIAIVAAVLVASMGLRLGLLVASVVPLVALASLGLYAMGGGILHQLSVSALILALGLLVDNAIVVAESAQQHVDAGVPPAEAARRAIGELAVPLAAATATTLAAFVPMLAARGATADFTRAIPIVTMLTLTVSYLFALTVTPALAALVLRPQPRHEASAVGRLAAWAGRIGTRYPRRVTLAAAGAVALSLLAAGFVGRQFFPEADRDQFVVEVLLPEGSHLETTSAAARVVERHLLEQPGVRRVASFVGRSAPSFYYNLPRRPQSPHFAHLLVVTRDRRENALLMAALDEFARRELPIAEVIPRALEQGPPLDAPVEVRLFGDDLASLARATDLAMAAVKAIPASRHVRHDFGAGSPTVTFAVDDAAAARRGFDREQLALAVLQQTRGLELGELRSGDEPVPIVVRSAAGEDLDPLHITSLEASAPDASVVPLSQVARLGIEWRPAVIHHRNQQRMVTVASQLAPGTDYSDVLGELTPRLRGLEWPSGVRWDYGGAVEGAGEANQAIAAAAPLGGLLLLFFVLLEFNSFRRVAIILSTVPLAAAGVVPGLLLGGQPFGFMSLLGVFALIGIVVNNAIVLLHVVEARRAAGATVVQAMRAAVELRTRPILLTSATTVAGLMPLALSDSPLWPPMAFAMITGLTASTLLTLLVVPALYTLAFRDPRTEATA
jgi:multidrug efflux pump subunit AcrB